MSFQQITVLGNLGQAATVNTVKGDFVVNFSLAVNKTWLDASGAKQQRTTWFECAYWFRNGKQPRVVDYLLGGKQVLVTGEVTLETYITRDGRPGAKMVLTVDSLTLADSSTRPEQPAQPAALGESPAPVPVPSPAPPPSKSTGKKAAANHDDIPF
jgi:single-strand DNA-binding protein